MSTPTVSNTKATVRTYRQGLGDCHLVTLKNSTGKKYTILIDCGVILGTDGAPQMMQKVMKNVIDETGGRVDLLVPTHMHWDHLSGFLQAADLFKKLQVGDVWMAWTEDPNDADAIRLKEEHRKAIALLQNTAARLQLAGDHGPSLLTSLLEFFGTASGGTSQDALDAARNKSPSPRYCDPADLPVELPDFGARIYVLGPPRDEKLLKKTLPTKSAPETYTLALNAFTIGVGSILGDEDAEQPFAEQYRVPVNVAHTLPFFQKNYWNRERWRGIETAWSDDATQFALALDNMTNNTSLVLAIDLGDKGVLLFAADAQVGNWLSWTDCSWDVAAKKVSGEDLMVRTVFYKVGHHGSRNATLAAKGLELMESLKFAIVPVDHAMALVKNWGDIPLANLLIALKKITATNGGYILRTDTDAVPISDFPGLTTEKLFHQIEVF
jgi:beta-lactamase superfamily II metal-dependent hydrolase